MNRQNTIIKGHLTTGIAPIFYWIWIGKNWKTSILLYVFTITWYIAILLNDTININSGKYSENSSLELKTIKQKKNTEQEKR
jgi:hypothetical protein